jgi:rod shape-determining protein MreB
VLERTAPDVVGDIKEDGLYLTGGGARISGFDKLLSEYIGTEVIMADDPEHSVVKGEGIAIKRPELLENGDYLYRSIKELIVEQ